MRHGSVLNDRALIRRLPLLLVFLLIGGSLALSCEVINPTVPEAVPTSDRPPTPRPRPTPTVALGPDSGFTERVNLDTIAPRGKGRDLVIMNCDYCHSWICTVRNQRTFDHWMMVEEVHSGRGWVVLNDEDWDTLWRYLEDNFNDQKPEPDVPPAFKDAGCTHSAYR